MNEHDKQFLDLYQKYRYEDQKNWYEGRRVEFEAARDQVITLNVALMGLAAAAAVLAAADVFRLKALWAVLAVIFPVLSTAISAYDGLYAFERQAKLYQDAFNALLRVRADAPDLKQGITEAGYRSALSAYVNQVEAVSRREQGQWGQLMSEIKPSEPPDNPPPKA